MGTGKITDAAIAIIVLIIGLWILTRLGLNLPAIESMFHKFFFPSSSPTNATAGIVMGMSLTASRIREKRIRVKEFLKRKIFLKRIKILPKQPQEGGRKP